MSYQPILGFAPDADPTTPGVLVDCNYIYPTSRGYRVMPLPMQLDGANAGHASMSVYPTATVLNAKVFRSSLNKVTVLAGTANSIYALSYAGGGSAFPSTSNYANWWNASRAAGYTASVDQTWMFEQFGDYLLALKGGAQTVVGDITLQAYSTATGTFEDVTGAPAAATMVVAERFVMLLNAPAFAADAWWCSARDDHTSWSLSP